VKVVRPAMTSREAEVPWESKAKYRAIWPGIVAPAHLYTGPLLAGKKQPGRMYHDLIIVVGCFQSGNTLVTMPQLAALCYKRPT
jgi:hypothetical protein